MKRLQLTLFPEAGDAWTIEAVRKAFNPQQFALIGAHVTLCREDELVPIERLIPRLDRLQFGRFSLSFGHPLRFSGGTGVLLPAVGDVSPFYRLREHILAGFADTSRRPEPHITLMHPRNSTCTDAIFAQLRQFEFPQLVTFRNVSLIEQANEGPWAVLRVFEL